MTGDKIPVQMQRIVTKLGLKDSAANRARAATVETIAKSDLIIGMSRHHRSAGVLLYPPAVRQAFTLLELAHVVSQIDEQDVGYIMEQHSDIEFAVLDTVMRMHRLVRRLSPEDLYDVDIH